MRRVLVPAVLVAVLTVPCAHAAIHRLVAGTPVYRTDFSNIQFYLDSSVKAGATNAKGNVVITAGSDPAGAANRAAGHWNGAGGSGVHFAAVQQPPPSNAPNVITIEDTPDNESVTNGALGVTVIETSGAAIVSATVILNPAPVDPSAGKVAAFSTQSAVGTFDLEAVITHEFGHALGLDHTGALAGTMYASRHTLEDNTGYPDAPLDEGLSSDETAFAASLYPAGGAAVFGTIEGTVQSGSGAPVSGAVLIATEPTAGVVLCGLTTPQGAYTISAPPGNYQIYAQPLVGFFTAANVYSLIGQTVDTAYKTTFFGGNGSPAYLNVGAGHTATANITLGDGTDSVTIEAMGTMALNGSTYRGAFTGLALTPGQTASVLLWGPGIDSSLNAANVVVIGPGVTVVSAGPAPSWVQGPNGWQALEVTLNVAAGAGRSDVTLGITKNGDYGMAAGALEIGQGSSGASFNTLNMKNAGSYSPGAVAAGEMFALFGGGLGPAAGVSLSLPAGTTILPGEVGNVQVLFDGAPAPLLYVSNGQINGIVPFEVAGETATSVVVSYNGAKSAPVSIPVQDSLPSIFTANYSGSGQGAILNQDNITPNSAAHPAHPGDIVAIYATGFGQTNPAGTDGLLSTAAYPKPLLNVTAQVGGENAHVHYAGSAPNFVAGFMQVNVSIPCDVTASNVSVVLQVGNNQSQSGVTIAVAGPPDSNVCPQ